VRDAFIRGLTALASQDDRVVLLTGDLGFKLFDDFARTYPGRFINAGIAEANMMSVAAGLAMQGWNPWAYSIVPFATLRSFEQIRNDVCYNDAPVRVAGIGGGYSYGPNGPTHHALEDVAVMRTLPNMTVLCPGDPVEVELAVRASATHSGPLYLRLGRAGDPVVHRSKPDFQIGRAIELSGGTDCSLVSMGGILPVARKTAEILAARGISARLISMHTVKPVDGETIRRCLAETGVIFTIEEHSLIGGLGSAIGEWMVANGAAGRLHSLGTADEFAHSCGSQAFLREKAGLTAESLAGRIARTLRGHAC